MYHANRATLESPCCAAWEQAKQYLPAHSRAVQINGATHNVHRGKFNAFMQVVKDFLSNVC